jgi:hypothetical protein
MNRIKLRPSPSTAIAVIALVTALCGTAYAAGAFTGKQKKQVSKIAAGVFNRSISGASANRALSSGAAGRAEMAVRAETAAKAPEATIATKATEVTRATEAATAPKADEASTAQRVPLADTATRADSVPAATRATNAANAATLGGLGPAELQRSVAASCPPPSAIVSLAQGGGVQCDRPVRSFQAALVRGGSAEIPLGNGLQLNFTCERGIEAGFLNWINVSGGPVDLDLFSFIGARKIVAGQTVSASDSRSEGVLDSVLEGQYIWATPRAVTTVMVHAFHRPGSCEIGGTAVTALG